MREGELNFAAAIGRVPARPWLIDDLDAWIDRLTTGVDYTTIGFPPNSKRWSLPVMGMPEAMRPMTLLAFLRAGASQGSRLCGQHGRRPGAGRHAIGRRAAPARHSCMLDHQGEDTSVQLLRAETANRLPAGGHRGQ